MEINIFFGRILKVVYDITIDNHHSRPATSAVTITSKVDNIEIHMSHNFNIFKKMSHVYAKLLNQYKFTYQLFFLVIFDKYDEDNEVTSEIEISITLSITHNLMQSEIENIDFQLNLEKRIHSVETQDSGWKFQKTNSIEKLFYTNGRLKCLSNLQLPLRSAASLNI